MLPHTQPRKKRNSSKVNLLISFTFHALIVLVALYFAARAGIAGQTNAENLRGDGEGKTAGEAQGTGKAEGRTAESRDAQNRRSAQRSSRPRKRRRRRRAADGRAAGGRTAVV